ncbi:MAG: restriction endonuclease subunit S [Gammaproteobacteria bacterium]|nr:restriction endonuclease subunit S [Gammaproteobacteria bacterium]
MKWHVEAVADVCEPTEQRDPRQKPASEFHYVDIAGIDRTRKAIVEHQTLMGIDAPSRARKVIRKDDVLVSTVRPNLNAVAMVPACLDDQIASTGFCVLRPNRDWVEPRYLFYWTITSTFVDALASRVRGANYPAVSDRDVKEVAIPLPSLAEQRRVVEILDQAGRLRRLRAEADAKANRILPALFLKMFGDPAANPMKWRTDPLGDAIVETQYGTSRRANTNGQGVCLLRMNNISSSGEIDLTDVKFVDLEPAECERQLLREGDIIFNRTNSADLVGKTGLWKESELSAVAASYLIRIRVDPDQLTPSYAWALMNTTHMKNVLAKTARRAVGMANINATELRRLPWMFPPLQLQEDFAAVSDSIGQLNETRYRSLNATGQMFRNVLNRAFSGTLTAS